MKTDNDNLPAENKLTQKEKRKKVAKILVLDIVVIVGLVWVVPMITGSESATRDFFKQEWVLGGARILLGVALLAGALVALLRMCLFSREEGDGWLRSLWRSITSPILGRSGLQVLLLAAVGLFCMLWGVAGIGR